MSENTTQRDYEKFVLLLIFCDDILSDY